MINNVVLAGRLTSDPEPKETNGTAVTKFRIAVDRSFKKEGGQEADFFSCVAFGKTAENVAQYCDKGMAVAVEGRVEIDQVEKDGRTNYYTNIIANSVRFLESKAQAEARREQAGGARQERAARPAPAPENNDPFGDD
jgi:single-strand DNA-binding protein